MKSRVHHGSSTDSNWSLNWGRSSSSLPLTSTPHYIMSTTLTPSHSSPGISHRRQRTTPSSQPNRTIPSFHPRSVSLSPPGTNPRFSHLLNTVLGSSFLTTTDLEVGLGLDLDLVDGYPLIVPHTDTITRPSSPTPTADFSIINIDPNDEEARYPYRYAYPGRSGRPHLHDRSASMTAFGRRGFYNTSNSSPGSTRLCTNNAPLKSILPRIWDVLSSPSRGFTSSPSPPCTPSPMSTRYNTLRGKGPSLDYHHEDARYIDYSDLEPLDGEEGELIAIDDEACFIDVRAVTGIDILSLLPTELALYIFTIICESPSSHPPPFTATNDPSFPSRSTPSTFTSGASRLRHSISATLTIDRSQDSQNRLATILACRAVSKTWYALANDNTVWRALFLSRWDVDLRRARKNEIFDHSLLSFSAAMKELPENFLTPSRIPIPEPIHITGASPSMRMKLAIRKKKMKLLTPSSSSSIFSPSGSPFLSSNPVASSSQMPQYMTPASRLTLHSPSPIPANIQFPISPRIRPVSSVIPVIHAPLKLDWRVLYRERMELDKRWHGTMRPNEDTLSTNVDAKPLQASLWEPKVMRIVGHSDSVYCLEFDSQRIITGSRDRTIKVWSINTGRLLATFLGVHRGSVLCLKFEGDWDQDWRDDDINDEEGIHGVECDKANDMAILKGSRTPRRRGFMVSGSSDCSVCVWDLYTGRQLSDCNISGEPDLDGKHQTRCDVSEREVKAEVRAVLKGHKGGVLDLKIDKQYIVSCSKDAVIRIWRRKTLELHQTLRGHEGPVNAVGLQCDKVVSASGDGKMILWDIDTGERLRTFEGHDRGLACIEFKDDLIASGSNDCKIKIWSASTGECLRTLVGHEALVRTLSFEPRTGRLVSGSYDKTLKLWDLNTGKLIREFKNAHTSHIFDVKFDVARIVSTSHDQKIAVLDFSHGLDTSLFV